MAKEILGITGMTCASCAKAVERSVSKIEGIDSANVNIATEKLTVEFDDSKTDVIKIKEAVKKAGYGIQELNENREILLPIAGMTCASCVKAVERAIGKLEGIKEVSVNLATEKAKVVYDTSKVRISQIKDVVAKAGYKALEIETGEQTDNERSVEKKRLKHFGKNSYSPQFLLYLCYILPWLDDGAFPYLI